MVKILWVDDEVELAEAPRPLPANRKGYEVDTCNNGYDAIDMATEGGYDLIILDEMMPGMTGLETLPKIKEVRPTTPVIMVTKSEEENIMDKAIGSKIADYIIKPVNPNQVLLSIKKNVHQQQLVTEQTTADYRVEFGRISNALQMAENFSDWCNIYRRITSWDIELSESSDASHQGGDPVPEVGGQPGLLEIRAPQLFRLDQPLATTSRPSCRIRSCARSIFPVADENPEDHAAADRQLPLRPVAFDHPRCCAATTTWRSRRLLLRHPPHGDAIRPQRHLRRTDAAGHRPV